MAAPVDLFSWPKLRDAERRLAEAAAARAAAERRARYAPRGHVLERRAAFEAATAAELQAGVDLEALRRELDP